MIDDEQIERNKLAATRGWLADPPPSLPDWVVRSMKRTPEERAALIAAGNRRYAHLANQRRDWIADLRKNRLAKN